MTRRRQAFLTGEPPAPEAAPPAPIAAGSAALEDYRRLRKAFLLRRRCLYLTDQGTLPTMTAGVRQIIEGEAYETLMAAIDARAAVYHPEPPQYGSL